MREENAKLDDISLEVQIEVVEPKMTTAVFKHVMYTVRGQDHLSSFEAQRRYKEFLALRKRLLNQWPVCYIPALPPKKAIGNKDKVFVEKRRKLLNEFMQVAATMPHLYNSEDVQLFIRGPPDYQKLKYEQLSLLQIHEKYALVFTEFAKTPLLTSTIESIESDSNFFTHIVSILENIENYAESTLRAYSVF